jgi:hypothetical protein
MCKELLVILVNKVVDPKRILGKKWRAKEEERHKGSLTKKKTFLRIVLPINMRIWRYLEGSDEQLFEMIFFVMFVISIKKRDHIQWLIFHNCNPSGRFSATIFAPEVS